MGGPIERDWYRCTESLERMWWVSCTRVMTFWTCTTCYRSLSQSASRGGIMCPCRLFLHVSRLSNTKSVAVSFLSHISVAPSASSTLSCFHFLVCDAGIPSNPENSMKRDRCGRKRKEKKRKEKKMDWKKGAEAVKWFSVNVTFKDTQPWRRSLH